VVCIFAQNSLPISIAPVTLPSFSHVDSLWLNSKLRGRDSLLIGLIYRPPSSTLEDDVFLSNLLSRLSSLSYSHFMILGDFNAPAINWCSMTAPSSGFDAVLLETVSSLGWHQHCLKPTRFRSDQRPSVLDLIFTNERAMLDEVTVLSPLGRSDHAVLSWDMLCYWQSPNISTSPRLALHRGDYDGMARHLSSINWLELLCLSPEEQEMEITLKISEACAIYIPVHVPANHTNHKYPGPIRRLLNLKRTWWARYTRTHCTVDYDTYLELRRRCVLVLRDYKRKNLTMLLARTQNSPKLLYRYIRSQRKTKPIPLSLTSATGALSSSPSEAAETLAATYQAAFSPETQDILAPVNLPYHSQSVNSLNSVSFPVHAVEKLLSLCDPGGSPGPDGIHPRVLKECSTALALPYSILFSASFTTGSLPFAWKQAIIHPIYKGGNRHDPSNYRPISLTSIPCKLMEKLINRSIQSFLLSNSLLQPWLFLTT
jgi:hypothetical protein